MNTTFKLTKGEIGIIISALNLRRMEMDASLRHRELEKIDNLINKFIDIVEIEHEQINLIEILDNNNKK